MDSYVYSEFFAVGSDHNHMYWADFEGWHPIHLAKRFQSVDEAQAHIDDMHPDYRDRLRPEIVEVQEYLDGSFGVA